jgi:hypothetical protein
MNMNAIRVSRNAPKIRITIANNTDDLTTIRLRMSRVGGIGEFAEYPPTLVSDEYVEFTFDDLLFDEVFGRYQCRLILDEIDRLIFQIQYVDNQLISVGNA